MEFATPLIRGKLLRRYKRFFADVVLADGSVVVAHCPNTGTMRSCAEVGAEVFLSPTSNPNRKLKFTWELTRSSAGFIGVNTALANHIVRTGIDEGRIPELSGYEACESEVAYGTSSRIDLLLTAINRPPCYVEVKNVTLFDYETDSVQFPDARTERGTKHLRELKNIVSGGGRAVMFFLVNRPEGRSFLPAVHIDPVYCATLKDAQEAGVELLAYRAVITLRRISIGGRVQISCGE